MTEKNGRGTGRDGSGRFTAGNPGRPKGTRNKTTRAVLGILEESGEALARQAVAMALDGDPGALRLTLERLAPPAKDKPVIFDLPRMETARDAAQAAGAVLAAVAEGELTPTEGAHVMGLVETYRRTLETSELEARVRALEGGGDGS